MTNPNYHKYFNCPNSPKQMIYFTKYAENKFDILNKHQVFFTREQIEETINLADKTTHQGKYWAAAKENIKVLFKKEGEIIKVITFYPTK